jgi:hypothetical protein
MKKRNLLAIIVAFITMASCSLLNGKDGSDGRTLIMYDFREGETAITTDDPAFKGLATIKKTQWYLTSPGTYNFEYSTSGFEATSHWKGKYTITANPGSDGAFLRDGQNGVDAYFELDLDSTGPEFYASSILQEIETTEVKGINDTNSFEVVIDSVTDASRYTMLKSESYIVVFEAKKL